MELLPPTGWPEFATHQDVAILAAELRAEMSEMKAELRGELRDQTRTIMIGMFGMVAAFAGTMAGVTATLAH